MYDYGEDKVLCMIIDDDNIMIKVPYVMEPESSYSCIENHHRKVLRPPRGHTLLVHQCTWWSIHQFVAILKFFLPVFKFALNLSVVISHPHLRRWWGHWTQYKDVFNCKIVKDGYHLEVPSFFILNFLQTFTCPKMVSEIILWSKPFSPLSRTIPSPSFILQYFTGSFFILN